MNGTLNAGDETPGATPRFEGAQLLSSGQNLAAALGAAQLGDVLIWSLPEPDKTYHLSCDGPTLVQKARGHLEGVANQVREAVSSVPTYLSLRVIVSTDHGRLMTECRRTLPVPAGMQAHGRAAWGPSGKSLGEDDFILDEEAGLVYLKPERFRLSEDCAVVLDEALFCTNDGRTGSEVFPHGGLYPEEVIVPWVELWRDQTPPKLECVLKGEATAGKQGEVTLLVRNPSETEVRVKGLHLSWRGKECTLPLERTVGSMREDSIPAELPEWPTQADWEATEASVECALPNGFPFRVPVGKVECRSRELYRPSSLEF
jgi:hypothetical protein